MSDLSSGGTEQFEFRGKAGEWFGIWIVNLLLSIITIGIYSAWAKVRTKKYFYNHTFVQGRNFDYHATGGQILIGRLIFIGGYIAFSLIISLVPFLGIILVLGLLVLIPWLIVKSMQFNARVSSFSNVRFNFVGKTGRAFVVFVLMPVAAYIVIAALLGGGGMLAFANGSIALGAILGIAGLVVMFIAFPIVDKAIKQYVVNNYRLGNAEFLLDVSLTPFIKAFGFAFGWIILILAITGITMGGSVMGAFEALEAMENGAPPDAGAIGLLGLLYVMFFVAFLPAGFIYQALIRNTMYNNTTLTGGHSFRSTVGPAKLLWIALSNAIVVAFTIGLMLPWAHVRMHKYLASQTFLIPGGSLDDFIGKQVEDGMSVADAYTDLEGVDFGVPL